MPPDDKTPEKTPEQLKREAEAAAAAANKKRNEERLERMNAIADSAEGDAEHKDLEEVTDEMWADEGLSEEQVNARAMAKAAARKEDEDETEIQGDEDQDKPKNDQEEETKDDEARGAGADDVRLVDGVKQYRLLVNGKAQWRTLAEIRATAQKVESADEYLQTATDTVKKATREAPTAEQVAEADRAKKERIARRKGLLLKVAMGDEAAAEELAELDDNAAPSVTPDVLRALDERFDSRVTFREAVNWFEEEYAPELKLQAMKSHAGELDAALAAKDPSMSPKARLRIVGEQIRKELKDVYGFTAQKGPSDKAIRKAEIRRPNPAGERRQEREPEDEVEDTASTIQKMAQSRHQPRAVVHGPIRK